MLTQPLLDTASEYRTRTNSVKFERPCRQALAHV